MVDKNGRDIKTGDLVRITGGYFKNDNGLFRVEHSPGDQYWCGSDHCLQRANKDGTPSHAKYSCAFWPLMVTVNGPKYAEAVRHNRDHAQIEVVK